MTQKTKLEILGPYTPEHEGPFCTRDGRAVRLLCTNRKGMPPIVGLVQDGGMELLVAAGPDGVASTMSKDFDLMNAREAPVAREFWVNEYRTKSGSDLGFPQKTPESAAEKGEGNEDFIRTIHVREVLPGEGA